MLFVLHLVPNPKHVLRVYKTHTHNENEKTVIKFFVRLIVFSIAFRKQLKKNET